MMFLAIATYIGATYLGAGNPIADSKLPKFGRRYGFLRGGHGADFTAVLFVQHRGVDFAEQLDQGAGTIHDTCKLVRKYSKTFLE